MKSGWLTKCLNRWLPMLAKTTPRDPERGFRKPRGSLRKPKDALREPNVAFKTPDKGLRKRKCALSYPKKTLREPKTAPKESKRAASKPEKATIECKNALRESENPRRTQDASKEPRLPSRPEKTLNQPKSGEPREITRSPKRPERALREWGHARMALSEPKNARKEPKWSLKTLENLLGAQEQAVQGTLKPERTLKALNEALSPHPNPPPSDPITSLDISIAALSHENDPEVLIT
jgi:hypothetical protein